jgi:enamine deaminase RidA (YjgF/YER057c/UK114 family)
VRERGGEASDLHSTRSHSGLEQISALTLGNVVMMRVYLGADPAKGGKMDFEGMMAGYSQFFGTREQPNKPARTTVQVVLPAGDRGALVEIDVIAERRS